MKNFFKWLKKEFWELLPVFAFFFIIFGLIDITRIFTYKTLELKYYGFVMILISALMMAKVVLISDLIPCIERYEKEPLIYNTFWKTSIYLVMSFIVRLLDHALPTYIDHKSLLITWDVVKESLGKPTFWVVQGWLFVLLLIFVAWRELIMAVGTEKVKALFFGPKI